MKKFLFLLIIFAYNFVIAQSEVTSTYFFNKGTIVFNDKSEISGYIAYRHGKIVYRKERKSKKVKYKNTTIKKVTLEGSDYFFKVEKNNLNETYTVFLKKEIEGSLQLFSKIETGANAPTPDGFGGFNSGIGRYSNTFFYICKEKSIIVKKTPKNTRGIAFRNFFKEHGSDCPIFLKTIKNKKDVENNFNFNIHKVVEYYNSNCSNPNKKN